MQEAGHLRELVLHLEEDDALAAWPGARLGARLGGLLPPVLRQRRAHEVQHDDCVLAAVERGHDRVLAVQAERLREHAQALLQTSAQRRVLRRGHLHHRLVERQVIVGAGHGGGGTGGSGRRHGSRAAVRRAQQRGGERESREDEQLHATAPAPEHTRSPRRVIALVALAQHTRRREGGATSQRVVWKVAAECFRKGQTEVLPVACP